MLLIIILILTLLCWGLLAWTELSQTYSSIRFAKHFLEYEIKEEIPLTGELRVNLVNERFTKISLFYFWGLKVQDGKLVDGFTGRDLTKLASTVYQMAYRRYLRRIK